MREVPFVRLLVPLIIGLLLYRSYPITQQPLVPPQLLHVALPLLVLLTLRPLAYHNRQYGGLLIACGLILWGYALQADRDLRWRDHHFSRLPASVTEYSGVILSETVSPDWHRLVVELQSARDSGHWIGITGKVLLYAGRSDALADRSTLAGRTVTWIGSPTPLRGPANPKAFDYRRYLADRHIHHQVFVRSGAWKYGAPIASSGLFRLLDKARLRCIATLSSYVHDPNDRGVALALVMGYKDDLTSDIREAYAGTGAMHILAVSGLHVGLVYLLLQALARTLLPAARLRRWVALPMIICGVWGYALLTGGAPSALRAATMFSFLAIGRQLRRGASVYNTLAASAFVLLCIQPSLLWQAGFQLSYLAVTGIVMLQPRLYRLWIPSTRALHYLWSLLTVSVSAQIATLPLSLLLFHQMPLLFWLSGLLAVPAASIILPVGLLTIVLEWLIPEVASLAGSVLSFLVHANNLWISGLMNLPFDHIREISIDPWTVWMLYAALVAGITALMRRSGKWLLLGLCLLNATLIRHHLLTWQRQSAHLLCAYSLKEATVLDYFRNRCRYTWSSASVPTSAEDFAITPFRLWMGKRSVSKELLLRPSGGPFNIGGQKGLRVTEPHHIPNLPIAPDWLLVGGSTPPDPAMLLDICQPKLIILETSLSYRLGKIWQTAAVKRGIKCHDLRDDGAWIYAFSSPPTLKIP